MSESVHMEILRKKEKIALLERKAKLQRSNSLAFYRPHPKQDLFHRAGNYRRRYVRSGNRFGKSDLGASEDCAWALGERPWYDKDDPARTIGIPQHSTKGLIIVQNWDKAEEIFTNQEEGTSQGKLFAKLPPDKIIKTKSNRTGGIGKIFIKSKWGGISTITLATVRSYVQDPMSLESSNWDWIHVDEPCPQSMWEAVSRGLMDRGGSAWFTCTPLTEPWINDYFLPPELARGTFDEAYINDAKKHPRWMITGSTHDNPYVDKDDIEEYMEDLTPEQRACRERGEPMSHQGMVYSSFEHETHIYRSTPHGWSDPQSPPSDYTIRVFLDVHAKKPQAALFFATSPFGTAFAFREIFDRTSIPDLIKTIKAFTKGYFVQDYIIDPIAFIVNPADGRCWADEFFDEGIPVVPATKELSYGILKTQEKFRERDNHGNPTIMIYEGLRTWLYEVDRYVWDTKSARDKPVDKDDHMMENTYRAVLTGLDYIDTTNTSNNYKPIEVTSAAWKDSESARAFDTTHLTTPPPTRATSNRYPV